MSNDSKMCAVVENIKWKPGKLQAAVDLATELQSELQAVAGRKHMISAWNDDGIEYVFSIWESSEAKVAGAAEVDAIGAKFGDMFESFESVDLQNVYYYVGE